MIFDGVDLSRSTAQIINNHYLTVILDKGRHAFTSMSSNSLQLFLMANSAHFFVLKPYTHTKLHLT
jgi:hypothetical protein